MRSKSRESGMALVVVLALLLLVTVLAIGFMSRTAAERSSSSLSFEGNLARALADRVVNLVQSQISHASSQLSGSAPVTWASQPGMLRTFQSDGSLLLAYKLYSDEAMVIDTVDAESVSAALQDWEQSPAHFFDLNAPVIARESGTLLFPIIDPAALNPDGTSRVEGFQVMDAPGVTADHPLPMPVRWLYLLADGSLVAATGSGNTATIAGATTANPVTGRVAFWTDDESCKLNINTAGHGTFWDIPRAFNSEERNRMARFQPALREFQRYPGHPATTSLWPVFRQRFPDEASFREFAYRLAPRVEQGGSLGGTRMAPTTNPPGVTLDRDRLYSSLDEILFRPSRDEETALTRQDVEAAQFFLTHRSNAPEVNLFNLPRVSIWPVNSGSGAGVLDRLSAFCATIRPNSSKPSRFYLERSSPGRSDELSSGNNRQLWNYVNQFYGRPFPGFGSATFEDKYTAAECRQISTLMLDYIRSSNLYANTLGATPFTPGNLTVNGTGVGQVVPQKLDGTKGIGRIPVLSRAVFQLFISGARAEAPDSPPVEYLGGTTGPTPLYSSMNASAYLDFRNFLNNAGDTKTIQLLTSGIVYFDTFDPMYGYVAPRYRFDIDVEFLGPWTVNEVPLQFPGNSTVRITRDHFLAYDARTNTLRSIWYGRQLGGNLGPLWMMQNYSSMSGNPTNGTLGAYPLLSQRVSIHPGFQLVPVGSANAAPSSSGNFTFPQISSTVLDGAGVVFSGGTIRATLKVDNETVQTYEFDFPSFTKPAPVYADGSIRPRYNSANPAIDPIRQFPISADFRHRLMRDPTDHGFLSITSANTTVDARLIQDGDVVVSLEPAYGDKRLLAARAVLNSGDLNSASASFVPHKDYGNATLRTAVDLRTEGTGRDQYLLIPGSRRLEAGRILNLNYGPNSMPDIPSRYRYGVPTLQVNRSNAAFPPDFDNGTLHMPDDAYANRADEGSSYDNTDSNGREFAWFNLITAVGSSTTESMFYSPNKQIPSAVQFGSLPTGAVRNLPWQTLLFRPDPGGHPGAVSPPDYLLLDLFWMPVVEPYAISEPFSTNGKVNMNYQIMPFAYLERSTALRGVLESQELLVIPNSDAGNGTVSVGGYADKDRYKIFETGTFNVSAGAYGGPYRSKLNIDATLEGFRSTFKQNRLFLSETQICSLPLIPKDQVYGPDFEQAFWSSRRLTGDNSREMPYSHLLPRLTTRSNTYTVYYVVQILKKRPGSNPSAWDETQDSVSLELRGSRMIERYIDPNDPRIPDYLDPAQASAKSLDSFYRWRVLQNREFGR